MLILFGTFDDELTVYAREVLHTRSIDYKFLNLSEEWVSEYFESLALQGKINKIGVPCFYDDFTGDSFEMDSYLSRTKLYQINLDDYLRDLGKFLARYESV